MAVRAPVLVALDQDRVAARDQQPGRRAARQVVVERQFEALERPCDGRLGDTDEPRRRRRPVDEPRFEDLVEMAIRSATARRSTTRRRRTSRRRVRPPRSAARTPRCAGPKGLREETRSRRCTAPRGRNRRRPVSPRRPWSPLFLLDRRSRQRPLIFCGLIHHGPGDGSALCRPPRCPEPYLTLVIEPHQVPTVALGENLDLLESMHARPPHRRS